MVPNATAKVAVLVKTLFIPDNTELEILFDCLILGWRHSIDPFTMLANPWLKIFYDETEVFSIETAIKENRNRFQDGAWNEFKLLSRYLPSPENQF